MLLAVIGTRSVSAKGLTSDGEYYDDGKLIWSKISLERNYQAAVKICENNPQNGAKWQLPTSDQVKHFYQQIYMDTELKTKLRQSRWRLGTIWTATTVSDTHYETADLHDGYLFLNGTPESAYLYVACVRSSVGSPMGWSTIVQGPKSLVEAKQHCNRMGREWELPTWPQLAEYAKNVTSTDSSTIDNDIRLIPLWTSDGTLINLLGIKFDNKEPQQSYVMCVR